MIEQENERKREKKGENERYQLEKYMKLLLEWNNKINLTSIVNPDEIKIKHFEDSLTVMKYISDNSTVIDIGTGAGFPGIPLKIMNPTLKITLVDSLNKRIKFLNEVIKELKLENIKAIHSRSEDLAQNSMYREKYDFVVSRAVANASTLSEYTIPFAKVGGRILFMKGQYIDEEIDQGKKAINILGGKINRIDSFNLVDTDIKRNIVVIDKPKKTPKEYPRKAGTAKKSPIV